MKNIVGMLTATIMLATPVLAEDPVDTVMCQISAPMTSMAHSLDNQTNPLAMVLVAPLAFLAGAANGWVIQPLEALVTGGTMSCDDSRVVVDKM